MFPPCFRCTGLIRSKRKQSGNEVEIKRIQVSALFPLPFPRRPRSRYCVSDWEVLGRPIRELPLGLPCLPGSMQESKAPRWSRDNVLRCGLKWLMPVLPNLALDQGQSLCSPARPFQEPPPLRQEAPTWAKTYPLTGQSHAFFRVGQVWELTSARRRQSHQ
jgi:hypothetical protein